MSPELDEKLVKKYPKIFADRYGDMRTTCMCWGFECGDGWYWLIDSLCHNLQWNTDKNNQNYILKNRILRFTLPTLIYLSKKIPGKYNLKRKTQINPLVMLRSFLTENLIKYKISRKHIWVESDRYPQITAVQVKEKFGGLRFYVNGASNAQYGVISFTESLSYKVCENCGSTKNIGSTKGWYRTLCEECHDPKSNWKLRIEEDETDNKI